VIHILQPNAPTQNEWLPDLKDQLDQCRPLLTTTPEIIIDKVLRNEYVIFSVNDELRVVGFVFNSGIVRTFFIYWLHGVNIEGNLAEMLEYTKTQLSCASVELQSVTPAHHRLYRKLFKPYTTRESLLFRIAL